jgi:Mn2+/Fe2+ NRAMP family transporter
MIKDADFIIRNEGQSGSLSTTALIDLIAACTEAAASPALKAASATVPVLVGSAAYALGEARRWPVGLARQPKQAKAFYAAIGAATLIGAAVNIFSIGAVKALIWSAVLNALVAVPVLAILMRIATNKKIMGTFKIEGWWSFIGWLATAVMAVASIAFLVSFILPSAQCASD